MTKAKNIFLGPLRDKLKHDPNGKLIALYKGKWVVIKDHPALGKMTVEEYIHAWWRESCSLCWIYVHDSIGNSAVMILDLKARLSKLNLKELRLLLKEFRKLDLDECDELESMIAEELLAYVNMRIKKLEKKEHE